MTTFYLILVVILFILAFSDLIVGVSNDAVNFLNSAVGAKVASLKVIIGIAAIGIIVGASFSSGMMEVARKGIFHPELFYFSEIILIFLAVMVTDVILLDTFNTFGMPTSTTVSIVFELIGAAVAIALIKVISDPNSLPLYEYINSAKALAIIAGILLSVVIAFTAGVIIQYLSRLMFSFDYENRMKYFGAIWGGMAIAALTYFILIKGSKGASFMSADLVSWIMENTLLILAGSFVIWTIVLQLAHSFFRLDIMKFIVLFGTFSLALAFAGNDLVNFIGVPLAGFNSYEIWVESGQAAEGFLMTGLSGRVATPTFMLLISGLVMALTLYFSKKARSVVKTSLDLGRQEEGYERFSSFVLSRRIVRNFAKTAIFVNDRLPNSYKNFVEKQFNQTAFTKRQMQMGKDAPSFDVVRASVTLVVASVLITIGTNLKLPLSTTYVTFMVFMGTSLADGAWGRESAVYRVTGVLSVIGGWFFTAFSAFISAFIIAVIFYYGGILGIILMCVVAVVIVYRTHRFHRKRSEEQEAFEKSIFEGIITKANILEMSTQNLSDILPSITKALNLNLKGLEKEDLGIMNLAKKEIQQLNKSSKKLKYAANKILDRIPESEIDSAHFYILLVDYLNEMTEHTGRIISSGFEHIDNNHKPLLKVQLEEISKIQGIIAQDFEKIQKTVSKLKEVDMEAWEKQTESFLKLIRHTRKKQIKRIKAREVGTRNSLVYLNFLSEVRNLMLFAQRMVRVYNDLIQNPDK